MHFTSRPHIRQTTHIQCAIWLHSRLLWATVVTLQQQSSVSVPTTLCIRYHFSFRMFSQAHTGTISKPTTTKLALLRLGDNDGGWHIIYHLSAPHGTSINDFREQYSLSYCTVDDAFAIVNSLGKGALMAKIDLKKIFRLIPLRPENWNLLGVCWRNKYYIDTCLPFGLRFASYLFNQLSTCSNTLDPSAQISHTSPSPLSG